MRMAGPAFTIDVRPGDNLMIHAAIAMAQPGDILVVDGKGDRTCALMGAIMITACKKLGLAGVVLDGSHRDTEEILALGFPVYSVGVEPEWSDQERPRTHQLADLVRRRHRSRPAISSSATATAWSSSRRDMAESLLPLAARKVADERARIARHPSAGNITPEVARRLAARRRRLLRDGETL